MCLSQRFLLIQIDIVFLINMSVLDTLTICKLTIDASIAQFDNIETVHSCIRTETLIKLKVFINTFVTKILAKICTKHHRVCFM